MAWRKFVYYELHTQFGLITLAMKLSELFQPEKLKDLKKKIMSNPEINSTDKILEFETTENDVKMMREGEFPKMRFRRLEFADTNVPDISLNQTRQN